MNNIPESKIKQFTKLLDGLNAMQFDLLVQQARSFYSSHQHKVQLTKDDLNKIEANCQKNPK
ncbi:hypothetical protein ACTXNW_14245 [Enterococcus malodoratus]|uniref:hypothetical protein n=1 Tax=Enterococcus malodoratus TaxID=71451 RepID=UPI003FD56510